MNIVETLLNVALLGSAWVLYLLLFLSVASLTVVAERMLYFRRNRRGGGDALRSDLLRALKADDLSKAEQLLRAGGSLEGRTVANALAFAEGGSRAFTEALESELARARRELERGSNFLGTIGNNSPFIGLFGTVIGVIIAFQQLGSATARAGSMDSVMTGIAEALVATGVGLFVAIPAVIFYNIIQKQISDVEQNVWVVGRLISASLETRERGGRVHSARPVLFSTPGKD